MFWPTEIIFWYYQAFLFWKEMGQRLPTAFQKYSLNLHSTSWLLIPFSRQKFVVNTGLKNKFSTISTLQVLQYNLTWKRSIYFLHALADTEYNILLHMDGIFQIVKDSWALEAT